MPRTIETTPRLVATLTLGQNLTAGAEAFVDLSQVQPMINVGFKSMIMRVRLKVQMGFTIAAAQPALASLFLKSFVSKRLIGPAGYEIVQRQPGWQDAIWQYMSRGEVSWQRCRDIAAGVTSGTRTFEQGLDFEEPNLNSPAARCWPVEAFRAPGSGLYLTLRATPLTIKGVSTFTITSCVISVFLDVFDVAAHEVPLPTLVSRYSLATMSGDATPSPGVGKYLRVAMANSPIPTDNVDATFGAGTNLSDDLSAYTTIDSFGYVGNQGVTAEPVDQLLQRKVREVAREQHSQLDNNAGNKSEFRLIDPQENFDGVVRAIPLVTPGRGTSVVQARRFGDVPKLAANSGNRTGLPGGFTWMLERVDSRTDAILNGLVGAMRDTSGRPLLGRQARVAPGYEGADPSVAPYIINAK